MKRSGTEVVFLPIETSALCSMKKSHEIPYSNLCRRKMLEGASIISVDMEGFDTSGGFSVIQLCMGQLVVVQAIDKYLPEWIRSILASPSILKIFFSPQDDIDRLTRMMGRSIPFHIDLQALTADVFDYRPHSLVDALNRVNNRAGVVYTKQSFGNRGFDRIAPEKLLLEPGFVHYAAADAWATYYAFGLWLSRARYVECPTLCGRTIYETVPCILNKRMRERYIAIATLDQDMTIDQVIVHCGDMFI